MSELRKKYESDYALLWKEFVSKIKDVDVTNCPEPHFPIYGKKYEGSNYKIAFVGIETGGACDMDKYKTTEGLVNIIDEWKKEFDNLEFMSWAWKWNFWRFVFQFLANFYNEELEEFKKEKIKENIEEILSSVLWANTSSIERFHITAEKKGVSYDNWKKVKDASKIFDRAKNILKVFKPDILILLNWTHAPEDWFPKEIGEPIEMTELPLRYYFLKDANTHLYWTYHPRSMMNNFNQFSLAILQDIKTRKIFSNFPGEKLLEKHNQEKHLLDILKEQLKNSAENLNLQTSDEDWGNGGESYFNFYLLNFEPRISICFGFDKSYNYFSVGVHTKKMSTNDSTLKKQISLKLVPIIGEDKNYANWIYLHYYTDDLRNWISNPKIWEGIKSGETCTRLIDIIKKILGVISKI